LTLTDSRRFLPPGVTVFERGWLSSNNVLLVGDDCATLVDSGYATHAGQTLDLVQAALKGKPLDTLVNTHLHSDHCGGNAALQAHYTAVQTFVPPGLSEHVRHWDANALTYVPTGQHCPRFRLNGVLRSGAEMQIGELCWEVHAAPGHDPHAVVLFERSSRTLISADALWENGFGVVFQELEGAAAFDAVGATLDVIESLAPLVVIPGHGRIFSDVVKALKCARSRLEAFARNPRKHALHAAKVLLKFKLLEVQAMPLVDCIAWAAVTPYFSVVHERWFAQTDLEDWIDLVASDLVRTGAARKQGRFILNA